MIDALKANNGKYTGYNTAYTGKRLEIFYNAKGYWALKLFPKENVGQSKLQT